MFFERNIKKGRIQFKHRYWQPDHPDGIEALEGKRLVFNDYPYKPDLLALWGTPDFYHRSQEESDDAYEEMCDTLAPEGAFLWQWWHPIL